jgi:hypothetical protein
MAGAVVEVGTAAPFLLERGVDRRDDVGRVESSHNVRAPPLAVSGRSVVIGRLTHRTL